MKVALFHDLPSGGAKRTVYEMVRHLCNKHTLDVYTLSTADHEFCDLRPFVNHHTVYPFTPRRLFKSPLGRLNQLQRWQDFVQLRRLSRLIANDIDSGKYNIVLVHPCMWTQAPLIMCYVQTPLVYYCHEPLRVLYEDSNSNNSKAYGWRTQLDRLDPLLFLYRSAVRNGDHEATRSAKTVLVNSEFTKSQVTKIYDCPSNVCYHGIDTLVYRPLPKVEEKPFILSVGAIQPSKGFSFIIDSLSYIAKERRPALCLVGNKQNDEERQLLEVRAQDKGVNLRVELKISLDSLVRLYNEASLMVYAPHNEPFGLAPLEAMACGTTVVGVAEGGVLETVVDGVNGRLVERDPVQFAEAVQELLNKPELRRQLGQQGRKHVLENWTWERSVAELEQHLWETADQRQFVKPGKR